MLVEAQEGFLNLLVRVGVGCFRRGWVQAFN